MVLVLLSFAWWHMFRLRIFLILTILHISSENQSQVISQVVFFFQKRKILKGPFCCVLFTENVQTEYLSTTPKKETGKIWLQWRSLVPCLEWQSIKAKLWLLEVSLKTVFQLQLKLLTSTPISKLLPLTMEYESLYASISSLDKGRGGQGGRDWRGSIFVCISFGVIVMKYLTFWCIVCVIWNTWPSS